MASRKFVRDLFVSNKTIFNHFLTTSKFQQANMRLGLTQGIGYSLNRQFSVCNEFSNKLEDEVSSKKFQPSVKELREKAEELKGVKEDPKVKVMQTTEQVHKHVDGVRTEAEDTTNKVRFDPFSLVADELSLLSNRLRSMVVTEVPKLASGAEYFFKMGVEGKRFRPTVLLLMATALNMPVATSSAERLSNDRVVDTLASELRTRQQCIAEITEMIHVASLLHDDVLDDADTRRGIGSVNSVMGNKLAVLAGDFLLSRACVALAALNNTEVVSLLSKVVEHLVTGETMQMTTTSEQRLNMEYYMQKTYYKTASLISNSCKAIALLAGQTAEVATLAFEYGKNLGLAYQLLDDVLDYTGTSASLGKGSLSDIRHGIVTAPLLFAIEEFPQLSEVVQRGFDNSADVDIALEYLGKSQGIQKAKDLAQRHAIQAAEAINSLPENEDEEVRRSRRALIELTHRVITRTK